MEEMYCQSCGMPLVKAEDFATNKDGTPMSEYCIYLLKMELLQGISVWRI